LLQIALAMLGSSDWTYKYRPQHAIHDELCMVLQDRAFGLTNHYEVFEIPIEQYNPRSPSCVRVTEIALGPDCETTVRNVSLYFNIDVDSVEMCTPQQAKRFRWKRGVKKGEKEKPKQQSKFDTLDGFEMVRPRDAVAFDLVKAAMTHRLAVLQTERISETKQRFSELQKLDDVKKDLQRRFDDMKKDWTTWAWPVNRGREKVDKKTPVPRVEGEYNFAKRTTGFGSSTQCIWESFVNGPFDKTNSMAPLSETSSINKSGKRLPIFRKLALGQPVDLDRTLPLIAKHAPNLSSGPLADPDEHQKEHCWKALLLNGMEEAGEVNEWEEVREHFDKSRSKKVLTIIQQKTSPSPVMGQASYY
jgi:hypothetical protein